MADTKRITAANAPINEVAFGLVFKSIPLRTVHYGMYGETLKADFPNSSDQSPIMELGRDFNESFQGMFPLPRVWYEGRDGRQLIQLQPNRFHLNWRRLSPNDDYPKYDTLKPKFFEHWNRFSTWIASVSKELAPVIEKFELTYTNLIDESNGWKSAADYSRLFSFLSRGAPLTSLAGCAVNFVFDLEGVGQIQVSIKQGVRNADKRPVVIFEIAARSSVVKDTSVWFDNAHDAIVEMFLQITSEEAKSLWQVSQ